MFYSTLIFTKEIYNDFMKSLVETINEGKYNSLVDGFWEKYAKDFWQKLELADDDEIVIESVHQFLDYIYEKGSDLDKKCVLKGVKLFWDEYGK